MPASFLPCQNDRTVAGYALVFPGQGSQKPGMGREFYDSGGSAARTFGTISEAVGIDVADLCLNADEQTLRQTENTQLALFAVSIAAFESIRNKVPAAPRAMAGHSVGEYAALAASGVLSVADGARLVRTRGELMSRAGVSRKGSMAAVLGLDDGAIAAICAQVSTAGHEVVIANSNCPGQTVISGDANAVDEAAALLKGAGAKRCLLLNVSGAFHSPLMAAAAESLAQALDSVEFSGGTVPVVSNVTAKPETDWVNLLKQQLTSRVQWAESVREMRQMGCSVFVESGSGEVLTGLLKRIDPEATGVAFGAPSSMGSVLEVLCDA
jgi:[acyl-carrier-protein] S-malonyltransferase